MATGTFAVTPEALGAVGDGVTNDTAAFQLAAQTIKRAGGGTLRPTAGRTYRVGRQYHVAGQYPYCQAETVFTIADIPGKVTIDGNGPIMELADGMRLADSTKTLDNPHTQPCHAVIGTSGPKWGISFRLPTAMMSRSRI